MAGLPVAPGFGQVVTDGSVGPAVVVDGPDHVIGAELGRQAGANLFHSFERFSVPTGGSATFQGPESVGRVIGRVTGGAASSIDGTLRVDIPSADLYLFNPAGMVIGPNARLDTSGSVHLGTADRLEFADGTTFDADPGAAATLTVAAPAAFGFLDGSPAALSARGAVLAVQPGETLTLSGGAVTLEDTVVTVGSGTLGVTATGGAGRAAVDPTAPPPPGPKPSGPVRVAATVPGTAGLDVFTLPERPEGGGALVLRGGRIDVDGAVVSSTGTTGAPGADIAVDAAGEVLVRNAGSIAAASLGPGQAGDVTIRAGSVRVSDGAGIRSQAYAAGGAGAVDVAATEDIVLAGAGPGATAGISSDSLFEATGAAGSVAVAARTVVLSEYASIESGSYGAGPGGPVNVAAVERVSMGPETFIVANASGTGDAGSVVLRADRIAMGRDSFIGTVSLGSGDGGPISVAAATALDMTERAQIASSALGSGAAGPLLIAAPDIVLRGQSGIQGFTDGIGAGGPLVIRAERLTLENSGIGTDTLADGPAGSADIRATDSIVLIGPFASLSASSSGTGPGGPVFIETGSLSVLDGASISSGAFGDGAGGDMILRVRGPLEVSGQGPIGGIIASSTINALSAGAGRAGTIAIEADRIAVTDGGVIATTTDGTGPGGDISIAVADEMRIAGIGGDGSPSNVNAVSTGTQPAGSIRVTGGALHILDGGFLTTAAISAGGGRILLDLRNVLHIADARLVTSVFSGAGGGGDVIVTRPTAVVLNDGRIQANAVAGDGGNILIVTDLYLTDPDSVVEASSQLGIDGEIRVDAPDVDVGSAVALPGGLIAADALRRDVCGTSGPGAAAGSSFVVLGRGALPPDTGGPVPALLETGDGQGAAAGPWAADCETE
jgi:filamentous hemagglutinin family protein